MNGTETVLADSLAWAIWSVAMAWWGSRWEAARLQADGWLTRLRRWEVSGSPYRRVGIRRWRKLVPDAGRWFGGRPRHLNSARTHTPAEWSAAEWSAMMAETRRAERVHWLTLAALPLIMAFNRGILLAAMVLYAIVVNVPCIALQRYNRARLARIMSQWRRT